MQQVGVCVLLSTRVLDKIWKLIGWLEFVNDIPYSGCIIFIRQWLPSPSVNMLWILQNYFNHLFYLSFESILRIIFVTIYKYNMFYLSAAAAVTSPWFFHNSLPLFWRVSILQGLERDLLFLLYWQINTLAVHRMISKFFVLHSATGLVVLENTLSFYSQCMHSILSVKLI